MKRYDLLKILLDDIVNRVNPSENWRQDYEIAKSGELRNVIAHCATITKKPYATIIRDIQTLINNPDGFDEEQDLFFPQCYTLSVKNNQAQERKLKNLRTDLEPYVCTLDVFGDSRNISITDENWVVWERIWCSIGHDATERNRFWKELRSRKRTLIYIQTSEHNITDVKKWNIYSYAYMACVNKSKFPLPAEIEKSSSAILYPGLAYNMNAKYDQFFDVYDVLNEVKYAPDLLTEFVKIYQVLELLAYRHKFQKLIESHVQKHYPIVRQIESLTDKFKKNEQEEFETFFKKILNGFENKLDPKDVGGAYPAEPDYLNADVKDYLRIHYGVNTSGVRPVYTIKNVADIVYKIRCGIVHNKETEFHLTYNNIDEYRVIVPLIRKLNELLLVVIMELINEGNTLVYVGKNLELY